MECCNPKFDQAGDANGLPFSTTSAAGAGGLRMRLNPKAGVETYPCKSLQAGFIMSQDRIFETGLIALGVISSALVVWIIFSI
jgi:hypothetical protein